MPISTIYNIIKDSFSFISKSKEMLEKEINGTFTNEGDCIGRENNFFNINIYFKNNSIDGYFEKAPGVKFSGKINNFKILIHKIFKVSIKIKFFSIRNGSTIELGDGKIKIYYNSQGFPLVSWRTDSEIIIQYSLKNTILWKNN